MIYIRAGLYAEGRTDYEFLLPLVNKLLDEWAAKLFSGAYELAETLGIDSPIGTTGGRAERIRSAILDYVDYCDIFIIHADGAGDPHEARVTQRPPSFFRQTPKPRTIPKASFVNSSATAIPVFH